MNSTVSGPAPISASASADQSPAARDRSDVASCAAAALFLELLRASATELGWTEEALAVHVKGDPKYRGYVHRVLSGERPLRLAFFVALPEELQALVHARRAAQLGHLVAPPIDDHEAARGMVLAGLCALIGPRLPAKAGAPLKVSLGAPVAARKLGRAR